MSRRTATPATASFFTTTPFETTGPRLHRQVPAEPPGDGYARNVAPPTTEATHAFRSSARLRRPHLGAHARAPGGAAQPGRGRRALPTPRFRLLGGARPRLGPRMGDVAVGRARRRPAGLGLPADPRLLLPGHSGRHSGQHADAGALDGAPGHRDRHAVAAGGRPAAHGGR